MSINISGSTILSGVTFTYSSPIILGDPYFANVSLLLHGDGVNNGIVITDSSTSNKTVSRTGSVVTSTSQSKFGGSSIYFNGVSNSLTVSSDDSLNFGTGDFTIETWVYPIDTTAGMIIATKRTYNNVGAGSWRYYPSGWNVLIGGSYNIVVAPGISTGVWSFITITRQSGIMYIFQNGVLIQTAADTNDYTNTNVFNIGSHYDGTSASLHGYLDEFRVTKGIARYTANFTPPTVAFPNN